MKTIVCENEKDWLEERGKLAVTASDAYTLLTKPLTLYARKKGLLDGPVQNERMRWGQRLQGEIARGFAEDTGRKVELAAPYTIYVHDQYPMVGATPDAIQTVPSHDPALARGALEIKNTDIEWEDEPPVFYQAQLQVQLSVLDFRFGTLAALHRGNHLIWADIMRHEEFIRSFLSKAEEFQWRLTNNRPPDVEADGSDDAGKAIAALYPKDFGSVVPLSSEAMDWTTEIEALKAQRKATDEAITLRENWIKEQIKDATYGVLVDGRRWSWKEQVREVPPKEARVDRFRVLRLLKGDR